MAKGKKSFILYCDLIHQIDHLTFEEKGVLFDHILKYVNDENPNTLEDRVVLGAWKPIMQQLKRDLKKFEEVKKKRSEAGKRSAELRAINKNQQKQTNSTSVKSVEHPSTNSTDNDTVNVNDTVINNINNTQFLNICLKDAQFMEVKSMQTRSNFKTIEKYLKLFDEHLISNQEQKQNTKEYKEHFNNWLYKQEIKKVTPKEKPQRYV